MRVLMLVFGLLALFFGPVPLRSEPAHGIAMYGAPALPPGFAHLPYVNPDAPRGGRIVLAEIGGFDSLNPFVLKGNSVYGQRTWGYETLMARNWDEPFALYGLLAESVEVPEDRSWVEFTLRPEARFSDGSPVTVADVLWSFETLGTRGHPRYRGAWDKVARAEQTGPRSLRITFDTPDRELPLIMGLRPVLKRTETADQGFEEATLTPPIGSGPYVVGAFEPGRYLTLTRDPDWWGRDLPINRGLYNIEVIRLEWYGDADVAFEAFRAGEISVMRETDSAKWDTAYDFPAMRDGRMQRALVPHQRPSGMAGLVMNTRRAPFDDWRVREALIRAFNFEFVNGALNGGALPRITSYFGNSVLGMRPGPATGAVRDLLAPFAADLPPGTLEGYALPVSDGGLANRANTRAALRLLAEAGWQVRDGVMQDDAGRPLRFDIVLQSGARQEITVAELYVEALSRLGIAASVVTVDPAQYKERTQVYDFDMTWYRIGLSLSPGNEQQLYWGAAGVETPGTRNWMGLNSPAAEAMIAQLLNAPDSEVFVAAARALDRVLTAGRYVIPIWHTPLSRLAHDARLHYPTDRVQAYGDWIGFLPDVWWVE